MTTTTLTVGSTASGRQFQSPQAAIDSITSKDLIAATTAYFIDIYPDFEYTGTAKLVNIAGFNCNASYNITLRAAQGTSFRENTNILTNLLAYSAANGVAINIIPAGNDYAITSDSAYTTIDGLQIKTLGGQGFGGVRMTGAHSTLSNCILDCNTYQNSSWSAARLEADFCSAINVIIINRASTAIGLQMGNGGLVDSCGIVTPSDLGAGGAGLNCTTSATPYTTPIVVRNTYMFHFASPITGDLAMYAADGHNATDASSFASAATGSLTGLSFASQFNGITTSSLDLRLKTGSGLIDVGASGGTTISMDGIQRPSGAGYDIGPWEYLSTATQLSLTGPSSTYAGYASSAFTIATNGSLASNVIVTPSDGGAGGTFNPSSITLGGNRFSGSFTYTSSTIGAVSISVSMSGGSLTGPSPIALAVLQKPPSGVATSQPDPDGQTLAITFSTSDIPTSSMASLDPADTTSGAFSTSGTVTLGSGTGTATFTDIPPGNYTPTITLTNAGGTGSVGGLHSLSIIGISGTPVAPAISSGSDPSPVATVSSVTVSPSTVSLQGGAQQSFTATVFGTNSPAQSVTWSASGGSIGSSGLFTASASISTIQNIIVTATSTADPSKSGSALVMVAAASVVVVPPSPSGVPSAPLGISVQAGMGRVTVIITPPASSGDSPVTSYRIMASTGQVMTSTTTALFFTLPAFVPVSLAAQAVNANGPGPSCAPSAIVVPLPVASANPRDYSTDPAPRKRILYL